MEPAGKLGRSQLPDYRIGYKKGGRRTISAILGMILICVYKGRRDNKGQTRPAEAVT